MGDTIHVRGEGGAVWEMGLPLPAGIAQRLDRGALVRVNPDGSQFTEPTEPEPDELDEPDEVGQDGPDHSPPDVPERPARNASTDAWRTYATALGMPADEAAGMSRDQLADLYHETED